MNIDFYDSHMSTLSKLMSMAEKHDCVIRFGFSTSVSPDIDFDIISKKDKVVFEKLEFGFDPKNPLTEESSVYFELDSKKSGCLISFVYSQKNVIFDVSDHDIKEIDETQGIDIRSLEGSTDCSESHFEYQDYPTTIWIKGKEGRTVDYRVYRPGMALKYFGDVVCDYLKEPMIEDSY